MLARCITVGQQPMLQARPLWMACLRTTHRPTAAELLFWLYLLQQGIVETLHKMGVLQVASKVLSFFHCE